MAAPTIQGTLSTRTLKDGAGLTSYNVALPTGWSYLAGDVLWMAVYAHANGMAFPDATVAGWTLVGGHHQTTDFGGGAVHSLAIFYKVADGMEGTQTVSLAVAAQAVMAAMAAVRGSALPNDDAAFEWVNGELLVTNSMAAPSAPNELTLLWGFEGGQASAIAPTISNENADVVDLLGLDDSAPDQTVAAYSSVPSLNPTGTYTWSGGFNYVFDYCFALAVTLKAGAVTPPTPPTPPEVTGGDLIGFTFNREQDVTGWHRHPLGGDGVVVESIAVIPAPDLSRDELWLCVKRTVNGATVRYIEFLEASFEPGDDLANAFFVDCGLTYDGSPATSISGLGHLEGQTVDVLADGAVVSPRPVVTAGAITLAIAASKVQVGLNCPCKLTGMRIEAGAQDGTAQGKTKRINNVTLRLQNTAGGQVGKDGEPMDPLLMRKTTDDMDAPAPLYTGDFPPDDRPLLYPAGYEREARVSYVNTDPLPATVVAIYPQLVTNDR